MLWLRVGALFLFLGVIGGAFGAHALESRLSERSIRTFETAVRYHLIHGLGLLAIGFADRLGLPAPVDAAGWLMAAGIVLFSGSLYALAVGGPSWLGPVTPVGGLCLIAAWGCLALAAFRAEG